MKFFRLIPQNTHIDFVGKFPLFVVISLAVAGASIVGMFTRGFNFGIDFTGGTVIQARFTPPRSIEDVRKLMDSVGAAGATVVAMDKLSTDYMITAREQMDAKDGLAQKLTSAAGASQVQIISADVVGPKVGSELKASAARSLVYAVLLIMIYIWFRFDFRFAPGATVALVHDMIVASGYYIITQREFDITAIAALLTIAGYSVNDTIVIYDRVRELFKAGGDNLPLAPTLNKAINLTLSRTIITSGTTLLTIAPIALFCTGPIQDFAETMLIGVFVGTYSTYYVAVPMTIYVEKLIAKRGKNAPKRVSPA